ncbi:molybdopterin molybdotransferase MoeA [Ferviditalea candida]|uniref:Molybdopterin molybdenumtransferase n=1 Tax=Ferviditalea candida TaxID=3108399 RepID=A0ABU5ZGL2_9BACL|nr:gephyrin-like molybdotransferase Glp [Paenibacillaceae bacterium T2]
MKFFNVKSVEETIQIINQHIHPIRETVVLPIDEALGFVLAEDVASGEAVPGFARSTVDGYAVKAKDTFGSSESLPGFLQVSGEIKMGEEARGILMDGEAMYIPTGGMLPAGSDAVVMIEHCENLDGLLNVYHQVAPGENVIRKGEDVQEGASLLVRGTRLRPQELGILAAVGITEITVYRKIRAGYISTGDEVVPYHTKQLAVGQVRDINQMTISSLIREKGGEVLFGGIVNDRYDDFLEKAQEMYGKVDFLVMSGGSSVGTLDFTTEVIGSLGKPGILIHGVSIKPGKPTIFAVADGKPVFGLPGHPASAMVIFKLFGELILQRLSGEKSSNFPNRIQARVSKNLPSDPGRSDYIRVRLESREGEWWANPVLGKSGLISTMVMSDGMLEISSEKEGVLEGEWVPVILFR